MQSREHVISNECPRGKPRGILSCQRTFQRNPFGTGIQVLDSGFRRNDAVSGGE